MVNSFSYKNKMDSGFSLVELVVAIGIAAIVTGVGITASTAYLDGKGSAAEEYNVEADTRISNADNLIDSVLPVQRGSE